MSGHDVMELAVSVYSFGWIPDEVWWALGWTLIALLLLGLSWVTCLGVGSVIRDRERLNPPPPPPVEAVERRPDALFITKEPLA